MRGDGELRVGPLRNVVVNGEERRPSRRASPLRMVGLHVSGKETELLKLPLKDLVPTKSTHGSQMRKTDGSQVSEAVDSSKQVPEKKALKKKSLNALSVNDAAPHDVSATQESASSAPTLRPVPSPATRSTRGTPAEAASPFSRATDGHVKAMPQTFSPLTGSARAAGVPQSSSKQPASISDGRGRRRGSGGPHDRPSSLLGSGGPHRASATETASSRREPRANQLLGKEWPPATYEEGPAGGGSRRRWSKAAAVSSGTGIRHVPPTSPRPAVQGNGMLPSSKRLAAQRGLLGGRPLSQVPASGAAALEAPDTQPGEGEGLQCPIWPPPAQATAAECPPTDAEWRHESAAAAQAVAAEAEELPLHVLSGKGTRSKTKAIIKLVHKLEVADGLKKATDSGQHPGQPGASGAAAGQQGKATTARKQAQGLGPGGGKQVMKRSLGQVVQGRQWEEHQEAKAAAVDGRTGDKRACGESPSRGETKPAGPTGVEQRKRGRSGRRRVATVAGKSRSQAHARARGRGSNTAVDSSRVSAAPRAVSTAAGAEKRADIGHKRQSVARRTSPQGPLDPVELKAVLPQAVVAAEEPGGAAAVAVMPSVLAVAPSSLLAKEAAVSRGLARHTATSAVLEGMPESSVGKADTRAQCPPGRTAVSPCEQAADKAAAVVVPRASSGKAFGPALEHALELMQERRKEEPLWEEVDISDLHPRVLIGSPCKVLWPLDNDWYPGVIARYDHVKGKHQVEYSDAESEWLQLTCERIKLPLRAGLPLQLGLRLRATEDGHSQRPEECAPRWGDFVLLEHKEMVWAKVKGYSWWPALILNHPDGEEQATPGGGVKLVFFGSHDAISVNPKFLLSTSAGVKRGIYKRSDAKVFLAALEEATRYLESGQLACNMSVSMDGEEGSDIVEACEAAGAAEQGTGNNVLPAAPAAAPGGAVQLPLCVDGFTLIQPGVIDPSPDFHSRDHIFPVGYTCLRQFPSMEDPFRSVEYKIEVLRDPDSMFPVFRATPADGQPVVRGSAAELWRQIHRQVEALRAAAMGAAEVPAFKSGAASCGLACRDIARVIQTLPGAQLCAKFQNWLPDVRGVPESGAVIADCCNICNMIEEWIHNQMLQCDKCRLLVHMHCYGETELPCGDLWLCSLCRPGGPPAPPLCCLCPIAGGALKPTTDGRWAHITCASWIPETWLEDPQRMEPIGGITAVPKERWRLLCSVCRVPHGACIQCSHKKCRAAFHPLCARGAGLVMELKEVERAAVPQPRKRKRGSVQPSGGGSVLVDKEGGRGLSFLVYCRKHAPSAAGDERKTPSEIRRLGQHANIKSEAKAQWIPPVNQTGCARSEPYNVRTRRGRREPEAVAAALAKRNFVENVPHVISGHRGLHPPPVLPLLSVLQPRALWLYHWANTADGGRPAPPRPDDADEAAPDAEAARPGLGEAEAEGAERAGPSGRGWWEGLGCRAGHVHSMSERFRLMKSTMHQRLQFGKSAIHGWGVFVKTKHRAGDLVIEYAGEVVRPVVADMRERRCYDSIVGAGTYMFRIDDQRVVDATATGGLAHLINHACMPNCCSRQVRANSDDHIVIFARRDIEAGEELTYDYRFNSRDEQLPCNCGCPGCRGRVNIASESDDEEDPEHKFEARADELQPWRPRALLPLVASPRSGRAPAGLDEGAPPESRARDTETLLEGTSKRYKR